MACSSLGVVGPGVDDGKELAIFSSGIAVGTRSTASWELTSCSPGLGSGRAPCGLMCGVSASSGGLSPTCSPQLSNMQQGSVGCAVSDPFGAW